MKSKFKSSLCTAWYSFSGTLCAGALLLISTRVPAQDRLRDPWYNNILEFTPSGVQNTFTSGNNWADGLAFNSASDLFASYPATGNIIELTPSGAQSTFASGLAFPQGLAFNSAGDLFEADGNGDQINEFTPGGRKAPLPPGYKSYWTSL